MKISRSKTTRKAEMFENFVCSALIGLVALRICRGGLGAKILNGLVAAFWGFYLLISRAAKDPSGSVRFRRLIRVF